MCIIVVLSSSVVGHLVTRLKSFLKNMSGIYNIYVYIYKITDIIYIQILHEYAWMQIFDIDYTSTLRIATTKRLKSFQLDAPT